jgi:hypothetical protein
MISKIYIAMRLQVVLYSIDYATCIIKSLSINYTKKILYIIVFSYIIYIYYFKISLIV